MPASLQYNFGSLNQKPRKHAAGSQSFFLEKIYSQYVDLVLDDAPYSVKVILYRKIFKNFPFRNLTREVSVEIEVIWTILANKSFSK